MGGNKEKLLFVIGFLAFFVISFFSFTGFVSAAGNNLSINIVSPMNLAEIARGSALATGEDDKGMIPSFFNITARVYDSSNLSINTTWIVPNGDISQGLKNATGGNGSYTDIDEFPSINTADYIKGDTHRGYNIFDMGTIGNVTSVSQINIFSYCNIGGGSGASFEIQISGDNGVTWSSVRTISCLSITAEWLNATFNVSWGQTELDALRLKLTSNTGTEEQSYSNIYTLYANVTYLGGNASAFSGATCYFYNGDSVFGSSATNSSGECTMNFTKNNLNVGVYNFSVNYSVAAGNAKVVNISYINISLVQFLTKLSMTNLRSNSKYYTNDTAVLLINITKTNSSGSFAYDPLNIMANATNAAQQVYSKGNLLYSLGNVTRLGIGNYTANVSVNYSFGSNIRWDVLLTNDNFTSLIGTAVHSDVGICSADFGAWSNWGSCNNGIQSQTRTDSSGCTEINTYQCSVSGPGCTPSWSSWSSWNQCSNGRQTRTRSDGCGSTDTQIQQCCFSQWQCGTWNLCNNGQQTRACNDINQCDATNSSYIQTQSCIRNLIITYTPQETFINSANNSAINFNVNVQDSFTESLNIKWYIDSVFQKQDSGTNNLQSGFGFAFVKNSAVKAEIYANSEMQSLSWNINVISGNQSLCKENWYCSWSICTKETQYQYSSNCIDLNQCGTNIEKPYSRQCTCFSDFKCGNWSQCSVQYDIGKVLRGEPLLNGQQFRICSDNAKCTTNLFEYQNCSLASPVKLRTANFCNQSYVEVYEINTNKTVSRLKQTEIAGFKALNIGLAVSEASKYCDYCYDGKKDFDETNTDCGGPNCPVCSNKGEFFDWAYYIKIILWAGVFVMLVFTAYKNRKEIISKTIKLSKLVLFDADALEGKIKRRFMQSNKRDKAMK